MGVKSVIKEKSFEFLLKSAKIILENMRRLK